MQSTIAGVDVQGWEWAAGVHPDGKVGYGLKKTEKGGCRAFYHPRIIVEVALCAREGVFMPVLRHVIIASDVPGVVGPCQWVVRGAKNTFHTDEWELPFQDSVEIHGFLPGGLVIVGNIILPRTRSYYGDTGDPVVVDSHVNVGQMFVVEELSPRLELRTLLDLADTLGVCVSAEDLKNYGEGRTMREADIKKREEDIEEREAAIELTLEKRDLLLRTRLKIETIQMLNAVSMGLQKELAVVQDELAVAEKGLTEELVALKGRLVGDITNSIRGGGGGGGKRARIE